MTKSTSTKTLCSIDDLLGPDKKWKHLFPGGSAVGTPSYCGEVLRTFSERRPIGAPEPDHCPDCVRLAF